MSRKVVNLYEQFKNTEKKLKIACDWDEVIQPCEPYALWLAKGKIVNSFSSAFEEFWKVENIVDYSPYGSKLCITSETLEKQQAIKNSPSFYQQAPFLTIAEDLLKIIKEDKVEQIIFLSAYDKREFPNGDQRKFQIFWDTFGKVSDANKQFYVQKGNKAHWWGQFSMELIPFDNETQGQTKADWIKENASDFDIVIDDNPNICEEVFMKLNFCSCVVKQLGRNPQAPPLPIECSHHKIIAVAPYYSAIENQHQPNILLVKNEVSNLKKEDFGE